MTKLLSRKYTVILLVYLLALIIRTPTGSTLFPYTTLFRSAVSALAALLAAGSGESGTTAEAASGHARGAPVTDRKSTRLNSSLVSISYAVFCLKKKSQKEKSLPFVRYIDTQNLL